MKMENERLCIEISEHGAEVTRIYDCLLYTSPSPRD